MLVLVPEEIRGHQPEQDPDCPDQRGDLLRLRVARRQRARSTNQYPRWNQGKESHPNETWVQKHPVAAHHQEHLLTLLKNDWQIHALNPFDRLIETSSLRWASIAQSGDQHQPGGRSPVPDRGP